MLLSILRDERIFYRHQFKDTLGWDIIESITAPSCEHDLFILLAYRDSNEEYRARTDLWLNKLAKNNKMLEIKLKYLEPDDVKSLIEAVFRYDFRNINKLLYLTYRKTAGNQLYIKQIINMLLKSGGIYYNPQHKMWCLNSSVAGAINLPDSIVNIIKSRTENLSNELHELIEIASCIGSRFSAELLASITKQEFDVLERNLDDLCSTGLIVKVIEGTKKTLEYEFFHDKIYQSVYERIDPERKEQLHFKIASELLDHPDKNFVHENILSITSHLLNCRNIIIKEGAAYNMLDYLYHAGIKAKRSAAIEHAMELFGLGEELLGDKCWHKDYENTFRFKIELAECKFICGFYDEAMAIFREMTSNVHSLEALVEIKKRHMMLNSYAGNHEEVIKLGIDALKHLGIGISLKLLQVQIAREIMLGKVLFRNSSLEHIINAPVISSRKLSAALEILDIMVASANLINDRLFLLIVLKIANLSAKYGNSPYSPLAYAAYSLVLGSVMGNYRKADILKEISLSLAELFDDDLFATPTYFCIGTFIAHWTSPAKESLYYLQKAFECGMRSGDYLYCGYSMIVMTEMKYMMGVSFEELDRILEQNRKYAEQMNNDILMRSVSMFKDHMHLLSSNDFSTEERLIKDSEIEMLETNESMIYSLLKIQRMYLGGMVEEAFYNIRESVKNLDSVLGSITQAEFVFYYLLIGLEFIREGQVKCNYKKLKRDLFKYRSKLQKWADLSPENYRGKFLLAEALFRSMSGRHIETAELLEQAIEHAKVNENILLEALGNYVAACYYSNYPRISRVYASDAYRLFKKWGAINIAERIGRLYNLEDDSNSIQKNVSTSIPDDISGIYMRSFEGKLINHRKEIEALSPDDACTYFLDTACRETGADFAAILLEEDASIKLSYIKENTKPALKLNNGFDFEDYENLPKKVIRYAARTYEEILISSRPDEGPFANDDYLRDKQGISVICVPMKLNEVFIGLIYLESRQNFRLTEMTANYIRHWSLYIIAKMAIEKEPNNVGNRVSAKHNIRETLTGRELEVLRYMADGLSNKEIAEKLHISSSTVKTHTLNLYSKLEVNSRIKAVTKAKELELI